MVRLDFKGRRHEPRDAWDPHFGGPHGRAMKRAMAPGEVLARRKGDGGPPPSAGANACTY